MCVCFFLLDLWLFCKKRINGWIPIFSFAWGSYNFCWGPFLTTKVIYIYQLSRARASSTTITCRNRTIGPLDLNGIECLFNFFLLFFFVGLPCSSVNFEFIGKKILKLSNYILSLLTELQLMCVFFSQMYNVINHNGYREWYSCILYIWSSRWNLRRICIGLHISRRIESNSNSIYSFDDISYMLLIGTLSTGAYRKFCCTLSSWKC